MRKPKPPSGKRAPLVTETRKLADIKPDPRNPREISVEARGRLKAVLKKFGLVVPFVVDEDGVLIGGHQRLEILAELGYEEAEVTVRAGLSPSERKALAIALNNAEAQGTYKPDLLAELLGEIRLDVPALIPATGFGDDFVDQLLGRGRDRKPRGFDVKKPRAWTWVLAAVPTARYHELAAQVEALGKAAEVCEVMTSDKAPEDA